MCSGIGFNIWTCPFRTYPYYTVGAGSTWFFRDDGLAPRQHGDEGRDLPGASGWRLHVVGAKAEREQVGPPEGLERLARPRVRLDGGAQAGGNRGDARAAHRRVRGVPPAICLRRLDLALAMGRHAAGGSQARDVVAVDLAPDALGPARGVSLQKRAIVERFPDAVDPSPAQHDVDSLRSR